MAIDAGFDNELIVELRRSDAVVLTVATEGLGRYQRRNELDRVVDALNAHPQRRLVLAFVGGAPEPRELELFSQFADRIARIAVADDDASIEALILGALPQTVFHVSDAAEDQFAARLMGRFRAGKNCVVLIGPYAFAEAQTDRATPDWAIGRFLSRRALTGRPPWLDVMGSIARAMAGDDQEGAETIIDALAGDCANDQSGLGVYLRLLAANWARTPGLGRLFLVSSTPDKWVDLSLSSAAMPVPHLRLVHHARDRERVVAERLVLDDYRGRYVLVDAEGLFDAQDKVVLIKPFGTIDRPDKAMLTAEHWRMNAVDIPLPDGMKSQMTNSVLLALGAGAFAPNFQMLFTTLLPTALEQKDNNAYRFLVHNPDVEVDDPLHRIEAAVIRSNDAGHFDEWLSNTYRLNVRKMDQVKLLVALEHHLNRPT